MSYVVGVLIGAAAVIAAVVVAASVVYRRLDRSVPDPRHPSQYEPCGGMIREGVCTLPFRHDGDCAVADSCRCGHPMNRHQWYEEPNTGDGDFACRDCDCWVFGDEPRVEVEPY